MTLNIVLIDTGLCEIISYILQVPVDRRYLQADSRITMVLIQIANNRVYTAVLL